jgi:hypothetical protein
MKMNFTTRLFFRSYFQHFFSSPHQKNYFSKLKKELPLVALFEQEKISLSDSGLFISVWAMGFGILH